MEKNNYNMEDSKYHHSYVSICSIFLVQVVNSVSPQTWANVVAKDILLRVTFSQEFNIVYLT